jgi:hypothetical protein
MVRLANSLAVITPNLDSVSPSEPASLRDSPAYFRQLWLSVESCEIEADHEQQDIHERALHVISLLKDKQITERQN